jgi:Lamin Tail Domain
MQPIMRTIAVAGAIAAGLVTMVSPVARAAGHPAPAVRHLVPAAAHHPVVIQEIFYNSPGSDNRSNASLNGEWVQLRNRTGHRIRLAGWTLRDRSHHVYTFGAYSLRAHGTVRIHTGSGRDHQRNLFQDRGAYVWNNDSDRATLKKADGTVKSRCSYSDPNEGNAAVTC